MTIIYGQENYALRLVSYLEKLLPGEEIKTFIFTLPCADPCNYAFDFSMYDDELEAFPRNAKILTAFNLKHQSTAKKYLLGRGFTDVSVYDPAMDNEFRIAFFKKDFADRGKIFSVIPDKKSVKVYMAKSHFDKPLENFPSDIASNLIPIQVGAALTDKRIAEITDNTGDNISERNRHYSEVTAIYWMWKNANADYLGLCHYRRIWKELDNIAAHLQSGQIDAVLPLPTLFPHSVLQDQFKCFTPDVWETTLRVLDEFAPTYKETIEKVLKGQIFYSCNMFILKREILHDLCEFMFPIIMEIEKRIGDLPNPYYNRYAGFCAEQLITIYFLQNVKNLNIVHAEKIFIE